MNTNAFFKLFANCIAVKGARRSIICDLQRRNYHFIPNDLYDILTDKEGKNLNSVIEEKGIENKNTILEYFEFLEKCEYIFWCDTIEEWNYFPKLTLDWYSPYLINNAIIDVDETSNHDFKDIFKQLEELGCKDIQIRIFATFELTTIDVFLSYLNDSPIRSIELILKYDPVIRLKDAETLCEKHKRVRTIIFHSALENKVIKALNSGMGHIILVKDKVLSSDHCGIVNPFYFNVDIKLFSEAQSHNTCLNRKVSIDRHGNIKNCPSMIKHFGNIKNTSLGSSISNKDFKHYWNINKDQINVCSDCEFRYICTDCRAFVKGDTYSKPSKCNYDPYNSEWKQ